MRIRRHYVVRSHARRGALHGFGAVAGRGRFALPATIQPPDPPGSPEAYEAHRLASATQAGMLAMQLQTDVSAVAPPTKANPVYADMVRGASSAAALAPAPPSSSDSDQTLEEAVDAARSTEQQTLVAPDSVSVAPATGTKWTFGKSAMVAAAVLGGGYLLYRIVT